MQDGRETKKEIVWLGGGGWAGSVACEHARAVVATPPACGLGAPVNPTCTFLLEVVTYASTASK